MNPLVIHTAAARDLFAGFIGLWVAIELISQVPILRQRVDRTFDPTRLFVPISLVVGFVCGPLVHLLYGGRYDGHSSLVWLLLAIPLFDGVMVVLATALRSLERPDLVFWSQFAVGVFVLSAGVIATNLSGLWGAAAAIGVADLIGTIVLAAFVVAHLRQADVRQTSVCRGWLGEKVAAN